MDCDGFLFNTIPAYIEYLYCKYGVKFTEHDFAAQPDLSALLRDRLGNRPELSYNNVYKDLGINFIANWKWHKNVEYLPGVAKTLKNTASLVNTHIITRRPDISSAVLEKLLEYHDLKKYVESIRYGYTFDSRGQFIYTPKKEHIMSLSTSPDDMFFDDSLHQCSDVQNVLHNTFLYDEKRIYQNNPLIKGGDMPVIPHWGKVEEKIISIVSAVR